MANRKTNEPTEATPDGAVRLHVYMARCGVASRRKCEEIISQRRVSVNGSVVTRQGVLVGPDDAVTLDGRRIYPVRHLVYLVLHKPQGFLCSNHDPEGRSLAIDLIKPIYQQRLFHVGRLDYLSSGLILFTNDGEFARTVSHPSTRIEKEYLVETKKPVDREFLEAYKRGIVIEGERYRLKEYELVSPHTVRLVLEEGKNREIRNVFTNRNIAVKRVHRVRIGCITIKGLPPARFRQLTDREVKWFLDRPGKGAKDGRRD
jgi:23S rRNA pseudouridine2605 synthase